MASTLLPIKTIESCRVAPPFGTTPDCASLPFTYFDVFWLWIPPVEQLFFYRYPHPTAHFLSSFLPSLKSSLSLVLKTYYILAGGFRRTPGAHNKLEHYYVEGDTVSFIVAECNGRFEDLASDHEREISQLECLSPTLPKSEELQPLLAVQVTVFPHQGSVIGTSMQHTESDGNSSMQFMHTRAETCFSGALVSSRDPVFDRSIIHDPSDFYSFYYTQATSYPKFAREVTETKPSQLVLATFTLREEHIQRLKQIVSSGSEERNTSFHCSTIVLVFAYVWTGFVRAKRVDRTKRVRLVIPADFRARLLPPIPLQYFGNCVVISQATANVAELIQDDGVIVAAEAVGKAIDQLSERCKVPWNWSVELRPFIGTPTLGVASSSKFKVYDVDFGLGRPSKVEIVSATKTSAMSIAESRDGQRGVEIGIAFPKEEMDCFKKYFFDGLKLLSQ